MSMDSQHNSSQSSKTKYVKNPDQNVSNGQYIYIFNIIIITYRLYLNFCVLSMTY